MDYKEKYEQALSRARQFSKKPLLEDSAGIVEYIFPELAEPEGSRIRKALIDYFDDANKVDENPLQNYGIHSDKVIAWLEKQGEQNQKQYDIDVLEKHITKDSISELAHTVIVRNGWEIVDAKEQKPFDYSNATIQQRDFAPKQASPLLSNSQNIGKDEQKPAWSEEDETGWTNTMIMIKETAVNHYTKDSIKLVIDWLESLKSRIHDL